MSKMSNQIIQTALDSGDPGDASKAIEEIDLLLASLSEPTERAQLLLRKALFLERLGQFDAALSELQRAKCEALDDIVIQVQREHITAGVHYQQHHFEEAYQESTAILTKYGDQLKRPDTRFIYEDIQQFRAFSLVQLLKFSDAIPLLHEILEFQLKEDDVPFALINLGICYSRVGRYEEAVSYLVKGLQLCPDYEWEAEAHCQLGIAYAHLKELHGAKRELQIYEKMAATYPLRMEKVYGWLWRVCVELGQEEESQHYRRLARPC